MHCCDEALCVDGVESKQTKKASPFRLCLYAISISSRRRSALWHMYVIRTCFTTEDSTWDTTGRSHRILESVERRWSMDENNSMLSAVTGITRTAREQRESGRERQEQKERRAIDEDDDEKKFCRIHQRTSRRERSCPSPTLLVDYIFVCSLSNGKHQKY